MHDGSTTFEQLRFGKKVGIDNLFFDESRIGKSGATSD
jgi:hypothetical protein